MLRITAKAFLGELPPPIGWKRAAGWERAAGSLPPPHRSLVKDPQQMGVDGRRPAVRGKATGWISGGCRNPPPRIRVREGGKVGALGLKKSLDHRSGGQGDHWSPNLVGADEEAVCVGSSSHRVFYGNEGEGVWVGGETVGGRSAFAFLMDLRFDPFLWFSTFVTM